MSYANQMAARDDLWKQGIVSNINQLFTNISDLGGENTAGNKVAILANNGAFGVLNNDMYKYGLPSRKSVEAAKGGKLNKRRKGLTF